MPYDNGNPVLDTGTYRAYPVRTVLKQVGQNNLYAFIVNYRMHSRYTGDGLWVDCWGENRQIAGFHFLEKKDGTPNENTIGQVSDAFGWNDRDGVTLSETDWTQTGVQITIKEDSYQGKDRLVVGWLRNWSANPEDSSAGGGDHLDDIRRNLNPILGGAVAGVVQHKPEPAKPPASPAKRAAWDAINNLLPGDWDKGRKEKEFRRVATELIGHDDFSKYTDSEWDKIAVDGPESAVPF